MRRTINVLTALGRGVMKIGIGMACAFGIFIGVAAILDDSLPLWLRILLVLSFIFAIGSEFTGKERGGDGS